MQYARFINDVVVEVFTPPPGMSINDCFTPDIASQFRPGEGLSVPVPPPPPPPPIDRAGLLAKIDSDTDAIYAAVIGNRGEEYRTAEAEATAFRAAGYPADAVPRSVSGWATAKGWPASQAADDIVTTAAAWRGAAAAIRDARLLRKEQIRASTTVAQGNAVMAAWNGFVKAIRGQLGI